MGGLIVVHNGIIENFQELREDLSDDGYSFETDTDTEAVVHLIDRFLNDGLSPQDAVAAALHMASSVTVKRLTMASAAMVSGVVEPLAVTPS